MLWARSSKVCSKSVGTFVPLPPGSSRPVAAGATMAGLLARGSKLLALPSRTLPDSVAHLPKGGRASGLPLTVAGAAADLPPDPAVQPGRTAFPFHPLARDH